MSDAIQSILAIGGAIVLFGNVGAVIYHFITPVINTKKKIDILQEYTHRDYDRIKALDEKVKGLDEMSTALCYLGICVLNHLINGNNVSSMRDTRDKLIRLMKDKDGSEI